MTPNRPSDEAQAAAIAPVADEVLVAVRNAFTLGASLLVTWSVALVVRFFLPRYLGPQQFGVLNFADSFSAAFFAFLGLGVDTYIQKEIPVRPAHASDFLGGVLVLRLAASVVLFASMAVVLGLSGRTAEVQRIVLLFGVTQLLMILNGNLAALLHASRTVGELAVVNVVTKLLWSAGTAAALILHLGLEGLAGAFLISEAARTAWLLPLSRRYLGIRMIIDPGAVKLVIVACAPIYLSQVANSINARVGVSALSYLANDTEVGWYSAAMNVAGLSLLISPLVGWVLLPLLSRASLRSQAELFAIVRWALTTAVMLVLPISLLLGLGAEVWIRTLFGGSFAPAALSLSIFAPMFTLTYMTMIATTTLILLGRTWIVVVIAFAALAADAILNAALVPPAARWLGPGGASAGAATAVTLTELGVAAALLAVLGARAFDRASLSAIAKAAVCGAVVIGADSLLRPLGPARLAIDAAAYAALLFALGAVRLEDARQAIQFIRRRHRQHASS